jgi:hypothetical protein
MPDLTTYESLEASSYNYVEMCADKAIDDGEYVQPVVFLDSIPQAIHHMRQFYLKASIDGVADDRLRLLRQWMDEAAQLMPPPPPAAPMAPPGAGPQGPAMPKPGGPLAPAAHMAPPPPPPM